MRNKGVKFVCCFGTRREEIENWKNTLHRGKMMKLKKMKFKKRQMLMGIIHYSA